MSKAWAGGSTRAWRRTRALVLRRDGNRCQVRLPGVCTTVATHAHHLDGKARGDDPSRIVAACQPCNLTEGDVTGRDPAPVVRAWWQ